MKRAIVVPALLLAVLPFSSAFADLCDEAVTLDVSPGTIAMHHEGALFNCCAWLDVEAVQSPGTVEFLEWERFETTPCWCVCCFEAEATQSGLEPGEYTVRVFRVLDNFDGTWTFALALEETVVVEGSSEPAFNASYTPCVESAVEEAFLELSWGTIKSLYR